MDNNFSGEYTTSSGDEVANYLSEIFKDDPDAVDDGTFYFETDYMALKGNLDYLKLLRTLAILDVQRIKVCQDIDKLEQFKRRVREDPEGVRNEILLNEAPCLTRCEIEKVPEIDWSKYKALDFDGKFSMLTTRRKAKQDIKPVIKQEHEDEGNGVRVRGRVYTENKPETFNQLWTVEEQLRLEQLLVEFPPEAVESRRWKKIADALGNRTTKQVCSRVQKYFKKLQKAGIAVPGRPIRSKSNKPKHVNKRHKHLLYRPTTFFPGVAMSKEFADSDSEEGSSVSGGSTDSPDMSHWVEILTTIKEFKQEEEETDSEKIFHHGYKCLVCSESPIIGLKWECGRCPNVSLCSDCLIGLLDADPPHHPVTHTFNSFRISHNPHYNANNFGTCNYLDPNYLPS